MSAKVEQSSTTGAVTGTASIASGVKLSKLATKSGFLIPKNKLSGSLIPIFRGSKKGSHDTSKEENDKRLQRKTKWGPDLTQDTAVKKGRALAYQTRVDQITQELTLGKLEIGDSQDLSSTSQTRQDHSSLDHHLKSQEFEVLELERREAIGEILRLNPSYKAPADYKPLLKEAKVPIPDTEYPAHNFVGLILGQGNDTHTRLEKETGAKIQVYGRKEDTGLEVQVSAVDGSDVNGSYKELHVHVSADTYDKVDAAVALIELLFMPVSGNPASVSGENVNCTAASQDMPSSDRPAAVVNAHPNVGSGSSAQLNHFPQNGGPWFSVGAAQTGLIPMRGFAAPATSNPLQMPPPLFDPSMFSPRSVPAGFNPVPQSASLVPSRPQPAQVWQHQYMPQPPPLGHTGAPRNMFMPVSPRPPLDDRTSIGSGNMMPEAPAVIVPWAQSPPASHPSTVSVAPPLNITPVPQPSASHSAGAAVNHHTGVPFFNSSSNSQMGISPAQPVMPQVPMANSSLNVVAGSTPLPSPLKPISTLPPVQLGPHIAGSGGFNAIKPPYMTGPRPQQPSSSDFTFQPHRPQNLEFEVANRPDVRPIFVHPNQSGLPPRGSQTPFIQPPIQSLRPPPAHGFSRANMGSPIMHPGSQPSLDFPGSSASHPGPPRHAPPPPTSGAVPSMQPRNFNLAPPMVNAGGFPGARGPLQFQQNYPGAARPQSFVPPNHQLHGNVSLNRPSPRSSGAPQVYDPFSPTAVAGNPQFNNNGGIMPKPKQDNDPEYDDLMASVGLK